jgi:hypothetical protein
MNSKRNALSALVALVTVGLASGSLADHSWGNYHWARTTSSFDLTVINSTTSEWDGHVAQAVNDWSRSQVLDLAHDTNGDTSSRTRRQCRGGDGTLRICNLGYGNTGWLGIAGISIDSNGHITTGYTKLNDTYFSTGFYDNPGWRQSVTCQELGHNIGLDHQDEDFDNVPLFTCMDYQDPPTDDPNGHDFEQLQTIYGHLDAYDSYAGGDGGGGSGGGGGCNAPPGKGCNKSGANGEPGWGVSLGRRGNAETFIRIDPDGTVHLTHVTWAIGH